MRHRLLGLCISVAALVFIPERAAWAQMPPAPKAPPKPFFGDVVPQTTGRNGYEELVFAAELFARSPVYELAQNLDRPLEVQRRILRDRSAARALELIRIGVDKPVFGPREKVGFSTLLPELQYFRGLARLLAIKQHVLLADGRVPEAISTCRLGLRFTNLIQQDTLIHGLVGLASARVVMTPLAKHLDQLGARDCEALYRLANDVLSAPSPEVRIFAGDLRLTREGLHEFGAELKQKGAPALSTLFGPDDESEGTQALRASIPTAPEEIDRMIASADIRLGQYYQSIAKELSRPWWERRFPTPGAGADVGEMLANSLSPAYSRASEAYTRDLTRMRLLAIEVAIRRYRWEHDALPASLESLQLGSLAIDPFTGKPFEYIPTGRKFVLRSAGAAGMEGGLTL